MTGLSAVFSTCLDHYDDRNNYSRIALLLENRWAVWFWVVICLARCRRCSGLLCLSDKTFGNGVHQTNAC